MREINRIVIHCSATWPSMNYTKAMLWRDHVKGNGWDDIGYHYYITRDGVIHPCRPEHIKGAHVDGFNNKSIGICYEGGLSDTPAFRDIIVDGVKKTVKYRPPEDNRTAEQRISMYALCKDIIERHPGIKYINGHNELCRYGYKACPCFDVRKSELPLLLSGKGSEE